MRILYFLSAVVLAVVLIVGCTGEPKGVVDPVQQTRMVPPPAEDPCEAGPCVNGDCSDNGDGSYTCLCLPGWTGTNCDNQEVTDADGDGVPDDSDQCAGTASGDVVDATGCSIAQYCPCDNDWKNHGQYVSCVAQTANNFVAAGLITSAQKSAIVSAAAQSDCGKKK